ncbi:MAG: hypothetical protein II261_07875, partial [Bacteroidaceae bacterium]|nr:hypothetical protein [Bacteroidaceae bacterium]
GNIPQKPCIFPKKSPHLPRSSANHSDFSAIMAVINSPQIGIARGKLGDAVYYRSKGNTNARGYNPNTTNRRTVRQQTQRSLFSSAVKFFSRGVQNLFVFAFEDKRTQESDYNAFMRYNAKRGMYFGPDQNEDPNYPALGEFILTQGSLPRVEQIDQNDHVTAVLGAVVENIQYTTVAELSQVLINSAQNFQNGDILTFLHITTDCRQGTPSQPVILGSYSPQWSLRQLVVDVADSRSLTALGFDAYGETSNVVKIEATDLIFENQYISCYAVIHSRLVGGSLRVSDCTLQLSGAAGIALTYGKSETWKAVVDAAWGTEQLSILQGGIARRSESQIIPSIYNSFALPASNLSLNNKVTIITGIWTIQELVSHLKVVGDGGQIMQANGEGSSISYLIGPDLYFSGVLANGDDSTVITWEIIDLEEIEIENIYWD